MALCGVQRWSFRLHVVSAIRDMRLLRGERHCELVTADLLPRRGYLCSSKPDMYLRIAGVRCDLDKGGNSD